jgi:hypothetical protein
VAHLVLSARSFFTPTPPSMSHTLVGIENEFSTLSPSLSLSLSCLCLSLYFSPTLKCIFTVLGESLSFSLLWFATILVLLITELTSHALGLGFDFRLMLELSFETDSKLGHKYCAYALLVKQS